ncbi:MAG: regulatory protein RecX [Pseudomonadales bacterium]
MEAQTALEPAVESLSAAHAIALRALGRREYSVFEMRSKLERHYDDDVVEHTLDELIARRLLSDERFTEALVRSRIERGQGPMRIRQELGQRGIGDELIDAHLTFDTEYWSGRALQALQKRSALRQALQEQDESLRCKARARVGRFLTARGYPADVIHGLLRD